MAGLSCSHLLSQIPETEIILVEQNSYLGAGVETHWWGGHPLHLVLIFFDKKIGLNI